MDGRRTHPHHAHAPPLAGRRLQRDYEVFQTGHGGGKGGEGVGGGAGGARERVCEGLGGVLNLAEQGGASASPPAV